MPIAVLYPRYDHSAIEERYASWQTQMLLRRGVDVTRLVFYEPDEPADLVAEDLHETHALVLTDPLLLPSAQLSSRLRDTLEASGAAATLEASGAAAAVPVANAAQHPRQQRAPIVPYLTLRELQAAMERLAAEPASLERVSWDNSDPGAFLTRCETLAAIEGPLHSVLEGRDVVISATDYVHRWSSLRGQTRHDLLTRISPDAKSILEFGCGEAPLGEALKRRQKCRVVGIELDPQAAAVAQKRIDAVYRGDVREIVAILDERFDWIIGGDIVEHLDEPWSFLAELRRVALPGARLLLSIPNLANAAVINDLLHGRFDYVYMGLTCVGHLRFFTRQSLTDMLSIAGWEIVEIAPQDAVTTPARNELTDALDRAGLPYSREDLIPTGYYVLARNPA